MDEGGRERHSIKLPEGSQFRSATVSDPYVLAHLVDESTHLYAGDPVAGTLSRVPVDFANVGLIVHSFCCFFGCTS